VREDLDSVAARVDHILKTVRNVREITVYDAQGVCAKQLKQLSQSIQGGKKTQLQYNTRIFDNEPSLTGKNAVRINLFGYAGSEDAYTRAVLLKAQQLTQQNRTSTEEDFMDLNSVIRAHVSEPQLVITLTGGESKCLDGFPAWLLRSAEIYFNKTLADQTISQGIQHYNKTVQRNGK
jgi:undecaprenyl pyrophosphate synthase